jgi:hypothetical protein
MCKELSKKFSVKKYGINISNTQNNITHREGLLFGVVAVSKRLLDNASKPNASRSVVCNIESLRNNTDNGNRLPYDLMPILLASRCRERQINDIYNEKNSSKSNEFKQKLS